MPNGRRVELDMRFTTREAAREARDVCPVLADYFKGAGGIDDMVSRKCSTFKVDAKKCESNGHDSSNCPLIKGNKRSRHATNGTVRRPQRSQFVSGTGMGQGG